MRRHAAEYVVVIMAVGISVALLMLTGAVLYSVVADKRLFDAASTVAVTTVLTGWGGGTISVIGAFIGYSFGVRDRHRTEDADGAET